MPVSGVLIVNGGGAKRSGRDKICATFHHLNAYKRPFTKSRLIFQGAVYMEGGRSYNQDQRDPRRWIILAPYVFCIGFTYKGD